MSLTIRIQVPEKKPLPLKNIRQAKNAPKPEASGLSREEIRRIVLEMIG